MSTPVTPRAIHLAALRQLGKQFPNVDSALAEIARLAAETTLPKGTVHVISDVHGEDVKLRHVINNASGTLRPLVEKLFADRLNPAELQEFLKLIFYPREMLEIVLPQLENDAARGDFAKKTLSHLFELMRVLARDFTLERALRVFPVQFRALFQELLYKRGAHEEPAYMEALVEPLVRQQRVAQMIRGTVRAVRNLAIDELIIAGDFWDRGPRGDRVVEYVRQQPNVAITWGNHDAAWIGACLGQEALIAHVLRISCRYRRLSQLEEGYGITMQPLERLVRTVYRDDPAECYMPKGDGLRDKIQMARMQKAAAIMQFKLEGQMIARNPQWQLDHRRLLHHLDPAAGTIVIDGATYKLRDRLFPTLDPARPYELSEEEAVCMARTKQSFLTSQALWEHCQYIVQNGTMSLERDDHLIFHGCTPVNEQGEFLPMILDGQPYAGRALFEAIECAVVRAIERPNDPDRDLMWYLWCGPRSPLFGKDRITTLENDLVEDKATHEEKKDPYFKLIHEKAFCEKVLAEFGVDPERGMIVNGHVPVKVEKGESPVKRSGKAITIDGAFSRAYGDHGFTLVLEPTRTLLARHSHFESVEAAVRDGVDIIPRVEVIREWGQTHKVADTERGEQIRAEIAFLEELVDAYRENQLRQS
jgi:fructose-1,6-bisphosphatase-3